MSYYNLDCPVLQISAFASRIVVCNFTVCGDAAYALVAHFAPTKVAMAVSEPRMMRFGGQKEVAIYILYICIYIL